MREKNRLLLIVITAILIIAVVFACIWISRPLAQKGVITTKSIMDDSNELAAANSSLIYFPSEIRGDIRTLSEKYSIDLEWWEFDPYFSEIDLIANGIHNASVIKELQGKKIGNYTIHIFNDTGIESTRSEVKAYLMELYKKPEYQIGPFGMDNHGSIVNPTGSYVELWVYKMTEENKKMDKTMMKGWKILVYPVSPPRAESRNSLSNVSPALL